MNSENLQHHSDRQTLVFNLQTSIAVAFERTQTEPYNLDSMINDVLTEFPKYGTETFKNAIRKGSLGAYGLNYKVTTQVVCHWIREYVKSQNNRLGI